MVGRNREFIVMYNNIDVIERCISEKNLGN